MERPPVIRPASKRGLAPFRGRRAASLLPRTRLAGPMPWVMAIMVALTVLAGGAALSLDNVAQTARGELAAAATVQILSPDPERRTAQALQVATMLREQTDVSQVRIVPRQEVADLLEPWLGSASGGNVVPLPALIDVVLSREADASAVARLRAKIVEIAPDARIDAQSEWLEPVLAAISTLRWMAVGLILLLGFTAAAAVWLAARHALGINRDTLEIVHLLGGSDAQIARVFQRSIMIDAVAGGVAGLVLGAAALTLMARQFSALDSGMISAGGLSGTDWAILALLPLCAVAIAVYTARMTVLSSLRRIL
ncbi:cell division protein [Erythrobacter litoralis]|uniref:cell division protein FtsX n=1 Tax=Erythrobacter litoralis TaxID=39960 RepID=UPI0024351950|nr:cell division protein [Erythrobacter litoralis]MDG6079298.1 cell division protein [Erythrobacter litoralis]